MLINFCLKIFTLACLDDLGTYSIIYFCVFVCVCVCVCVYVSVCVILKGH